MNQSNHTGATLVNHWQRGVPVYGEPLITRTLLFFAALAAVGLVLALVRFCSPLGPLSGMNDAYAWGIWKTFNVMTLTALGSGPLAVGMAAWVFNRRKLHVVMRTALVTGFLFYATGLIALGFDVGRAWNFWNVLLPWRWNSGSAMLEVAVCMPVYCGIFLAFENLPLVLERFYFKGSEATKQRLHRAAPVLRRIYPFMITGAYVLPLMHQSSLGGLLLLAGNKINPLWQTPLLPLLYLLAASVAGLGFVTVILLFACLRYGRELDLDVLGELGNLLSVMCFAFLAVRFGDLVGRGQIGAAFAFNKMSLLFLLEAALLLTPAIVLRNKSARETPRILLNMGALACLGGMFYRFVPTTIAFNPGNNSVYFPALPELMMTIGFISLGIVGFGLAVKYFAILPGEIKDWNHMFTLAKRRRSPALVSGGEAMANRITIDPVTRIEGHLRIDVEVDAGSVQKAWACCTMWRGIETILKGRDPREGWVFAQRFCGVCTTVHAMASVRAVEDALNLEIPTNAQYIRNLILIAHALHDHIVHFYHLSAFDWVDITTIPKANPARAASIAEGISSWPGNSRRELEAIQNKVKGLVTSGQLGIFSHGYWGHPAMRLSPEMNLLLFAHYLQALEFQRKSNQVVAILGGKTPHIQNLAVGGVMNAINLNSLATMNMDRLEMLKSLLQDLIPFVQQAYFVDACLLAGSYPEWFDYGRGVANYLAVPDLPLDARATHFDLPGGVVQDGNLHSARPILDWHDQAIRSAVAEDVTHAWYQGRGAQRPWEGKTLPNYTDFQPEDKYSWVKAPRYDGKPMQVGPLSNILVGYASGHPLTRKWTDDALERISSIHGSHVSVEQLQSTMGRYTARAIRSAMLSDVAVKHCQLLTDNILHGDAATYNPPQFPQHEVAGVGMHEAPRGTLSHWVVIDKGVFSNYQAVVPTTWNASPRDDKGVPGPYETSLLGNPVIDPINPLEILRTVHSFDPCMACACHTLDATGREIAQVKVL